MNSLKGRCFINDILLCADTLFLGLRKLLGFSPGDRPQTKKPEDFGNEIAAAPTVCSTAVIRMARAQFLPSSLFYPMKSRITSSE